MPCISGDPNLQWNAPYSFQIPYCWRVFCGTVINSWHFMFFCGYKKCMEFFNKKWYMFKINPFFYIYSTNKNVTYKTIKNNFRIFIFLLFRLILYFSRCFYVCNRVVPYFMYIALRIFWQNCFDRVKFE